MKDKDKYFFIYLADLMLSSVLERHAGSLDLMVSKVELDLQS